jgi:hypothetical protein
MNVIRVINQRDFPCRIAEAVKEKTGQTNESNQGRLTSRI